MPYSFDTLSGSDLFSLTFWFLKIFNVYGVLSACMSVYMCSVPLEARRSW